jgi:2,3-bisphosphoglycerate-independent phosphoglycerate mutase
MPLSLDPHPTFPGRSGPVLIVVLDGVGVAPAGPSNAVTEANTPVLDALVRSALSCELIAHGVAVGLPSDDDMGNSEVGHNALGAGRIFDQGAKLVNGAIASGHIFEGDHWRRAVERARQGTLHFLGLHSDGNVHSHTEQLYRLMEQAANEGVTSMGLHLLLDGRDVPPRSALDYISQTEQVIQKLNEIHDADIAIASGGGRMTMTMDRYQADWPMVQRGYECHTHGIGRQFASAAEAVETMYSESDKGDQYLGSFVVADDDGKPVGPMRDGDSLILFNFRGDRAIEISQAYEDADFTAFDRGRHPDLFFVGMLQYDGDALVPTNYLVNPPSIDRTMGEFLCAEGVRSFAVSETQKFGHVTYFWNGNRSGYLDESIETYIEIPSDNVEFNEAPAMKAREITDATIELLRSGDYRFGRINIANGDMVGHTGDLDAAISAMEVVDESLARLLEVTDEMGGVLIVTADHGNADIMYTETADGTRTPKTSHTLMSVPFVIHDAGFDGEYTLDPPADAGLSHVAATALNLLGFEPPADYQPSLLRF